MKGWRPSALCKGSKPDRAFKRTHSSRTSDQIALSFPVRPMDAGFLGSPLEPRGGPVGHGGTQPSATPKAPALHLLQEAETKTKDHNDQLGRNEQRRRRHGP